MFLKIKLIVFADECNMEMTNDFTIFGLGKWKDETVIKLDVKDKAE